MMESDNEKELVLGNRQLVSLFFVVVALCGVFFAMGYLIGRNSTKGNAASSAAADAGTTVTPSPAAPTSGVPQTEGPAPAADSATPSEAQSAPASTQPARDTPAQPDLTPAPAPSTANAVVTPEAGATYLQVTALRRTDADNLVKTLREQSLPAVVAASSKPELFRVLVGPYHQTTEVADAKDKLKGLGFANAFVQKQ
jgi:cell division septation protein DedD